MAVARARLLAMADNMDAPPDSPRDEFVGREDVRLNKDVMAVVNAEHDAAGSDLSCVNLLRSVPTPRLLALEERAMLPENKSDPQSQFLIRDIHCKRSCPQALYIQANATALSRCTSSYPHPFLYLRTNPKPRG